MIVLVHIASGEIAREYHFETFPILVGRLPESEIVIKDSQISRKHARIFSADGRIWVEDLNSTNHVFLNGERVDRAEIGHGDVVNFGGVADYLFLTRNDPELAARVLESLAADDAAGPADGSRTPPALESTGTLDPPLPFELSEESGDPPPAGSQRPSVTVPPPIEIPPFAVGLEELNALYEIGSLALSDSHDLQDALRIVVDHAVRALSAQRGFLLARTERIGQPPEWTVRIARAAGAEELDEDERETYALELVEQAFAMEETATSELLSPGPSEPGPHHLPRSMREVICTPLKVDRRVHGVLYADGCRLPGGFAQKDLLLFELMAHWAAEALERQKLVLQLSDEHHRFLELAEELRAAQRRLRAAEAAAEDAPALPSPPATPNPDAEDELDLGLPAAPSLSLLRSAAPAPAAGPVAHAASLPPQATQLEVPPRLAALVKQKPPVTVAPVSAAGVDGSIDSGPEQPPREDALSGLLGISRAMTDLFARVRQVARFFDVVLVTGEVGTGKKTLARALHALSDRSGGPLVQLACGSCRAEEAERRLFGRTVGSAVPSEAIPGVIDEAEGGVLLLEDVDRLPLLLQEKLERFLATRRFLREGQDAEIVADVKVVATSTRNLEAEVEAGRFHHDLYFFRLGLVTLHLPPLSRRTEDIRVLGSHWLERFAEKFDKPVRGLSEPVKRLFLRYPWRGNLLEMRKALEAAVMVSSRPELQVSDLPPALQEFYRKNRDTLADAEDDEG